MSRIASKVRNWSISRWDSGAGIWISDPKIPRAGIDNFIRTKESTIAFVKLADGSEAKISTETTSVWQDVSLTFPSQVINETVRSQLQTYITNEWGVKIIIPISSGASSYSEQVLKGYLMRYDEEWLTGCDYQDGQEYVIKILMHEFNVDGG